MSSDHSPAALLFKRSRESTPSDLESDGNIRAPKKIKSNKEKATCRTQPAMAKYIIVHKVTCRQSGSTHTYHPESAYFLDTPSLDAGDSKATPLRGKRAIGNLQSYLKAYPQISFVIERVYQCTKFHDELAKAGQFREIEIEPVDAQDTMRLRPCLFVLETGASQAQPTQETMTISVSGALRYALEFCLFEGWNRYGALVAPYLQFYHARPRIQAVESHLTPEWKLEVRALYKYLEEQFSNEYAEADDLISQGFFTRPHFPNLFLAGDVLVSPQESDPIAMLARSMYSSTDAEITIECETWSFDGLFKKTENVVQISIPSGYSANDKISITSLTAIPLRIDTSGLKDVLKKRGEIFWSCWKGGLISYTAPTKGFDIQMPNYRCMIDMETYNELYNKSDGAQQGGHDQLHHDEFLTAVVGQENLPPGTFLLLLPPTIKAFRFYDKKWKTLAVKHIRPVTWNKTAFERLVLDHDNKDHIEALVTNHLELRTMADVIEGKGNGLVILLHGGPGTGKTFTAEAVAEIAERPLYRLTCGDIGTEPEIVEKCLEHIFYLGGTWKAVIVLDEAEVFLEERTQADLQRNALVSVFLRALEYYDGILILTTNRVGTFDEAFKSRIHLALHYPRLSTENREQIWSDFIGALRDESTPGNESEIDHKDLKKKVDALARHKLNGRQIRNSIRTAKQLAKFKHQKLSSAHIEKTIKVVKNFEKYVEDTHGHTDAEWVRSGGIRIDKTED